MITVYKRYRRTDRQTDGQTTYHGNTALRYASRGNNNNQVLSRVQSYHMRAIRGHNRQAIRRIIEYRLNNTANFTLPPPPKRLYHPLQIPRPPVHGQGPKVEWARPHMPTHSCPSLATPLCQFITCIFLIMSQFSISLTKWRNVSESHA